MLSTESKLLQNSWADYDEDDNSIVTVNQHGQRVFSTYFTDPQNNQMVCEKVYDVIVTNTRTPKTAIERQKNWKPFGLEKLNFEDENNAKWRTIPVENSEVITPGVLYGSAVNDIENDVFSDSESLEPSRQSLSALQKLMNAISSKAPLSALNNLTEQAPTKPVMKYFVEREARKYLDDDRTIRVMDIPEFIGEEELQEILSVAGDIKRVHLVFNKETNISRGLAFVTYYKVEQAENAIKILNGKAIAGAIIRVVWSKKN